MVNWNNHFINELQEKEKFLNQILPYPTQFEDLQDDGILMSKKYVDVFKLYDSQTTLMSLKIVGAFL